MVHVYPRLILFVALVGLFVLLLAFRFDPTRPHARLMRRCTLGLMVLLAWNALPLPHLGVNPLSAWLTGALGAPGLGLLAVLAQLP